jgi:hypothetical protein
MVNFTQQYNIANIDLPLQFIISESPVKRIKNFITFEFNGLFVSAHCKLQKKFVFAPTQQTPLGLFLGTPLDLIQGQIITSDINLCKDLVSSDIPAFLEDYAGSYVFIFAKECDKRIYLDADGTMSLVYDPISKCSGSTASVLLHDNVYFDRLRKRLFNHLDILNIGWFPGGLTAHNGIFRLLCNHYLSLTDWATVRFWPEDKIIYSENSDIEIKTIQKETRRIIEVLSMSREIMQSLTAGFETRLLLSCAKDFVEKISFFTVASTKIDTDIANKLSHIFKLNHINYSVIKSNYEQQQQWLYRSGHAVGGTNLWTHPTIQQLPANAILSIGLGGEVGRGFFWKKQDRISDCVTADLLYGRFGIPYDELLFEYVKEWLNDLPHGLDFFSILDLAYLELRMASWAYAQSYAQDALRLHISPMISYRNYKAMFHIHPNIKRNGSILKSVIINNWPELLNYPINRYGGWQDLFTVFSKLSNPKRVLSKVRKIVSN